MKSMDLFSAASPAEAQSNSGDRGGMLEASGIEQLVESATEAIARLLRAGHICKAAFSSGKDSSSLVNLTLAAAQRVMAEGLQCPPIIIAHSDTGIESPVVRHIADTELEKIGRFAHERGIELTIETAHPALSAAFATKIIGGRALPSFPSKPRECSSDLKIVPSERLSRTIAAKLAGASATRWAGICTLIGTRTLESSVRKIKTRERGERASETWTSDSRGLFMSPILDWTTDDVFEYLGSCAAGLFDSYSDFEAVMAFYADAGGSSCSVVSDATVMKNSKPCGARSGCYLCVASTDKSARTMLDTDAKKYAFLAPLLRLRDFIAATECDWSRRSLISRTIDDEGYVCIAADQYSPAMCEELLRYSLTAQSLANALRSPSRVSIVGIRELFAIDFYWSLRGYHPPFHAIKIWLEHEAGHRLEAPRLAKAVPRTPTPAYGRIFVGRDWDADDCALLGATGLRDSTWEMFSDSCGPSLKVTAAGKLILDLDEALEFDVDEEGALMFLDFEAEEMVEKYHRPDIDWTTSIGVYMRYGFISLGKGQSSFMDKAIRRTQWLQRHNLHGQRGADELWKRCDDRIAQQSNLFSRQLRDISVVAA